MRRDRGREQGRHDEGDAVHQRGSTNIRIVSA
jgi:hypothetical protein